MMNKLLAFIFDTLRALTNPLIISTSLKGEKSNKKPEKEETPKYIEVSKKI